MVLTRSDGMTAPHMKAFGSDDCPFRAEQCHIGKVTCSPLYLEDPPLEKLSEDSNRVRSEHE